MSSYYNGSQEREWPGSEDEPDMGNPFSELATDLVELMDLRDDLDPAEADYEDAMSAIDGQLVRLERGEEVPGAWLEPRGEHLEVK
jgi:hypothetical protein